MLGKSKKTSSILEFKRNEGSAVEERKCGNERDGERKEKERRRKDGGGRKKRRGGEQQMRTDPGSCDGPTSPRRKIQERETDIPENINADNNIEWLFVVGDFSWVFSLLYRFGRKKYIPFSLFFFFFFFFFWNFSRVFEMQEAVTARRKTTTK